MDKYGYEFEESELFKHKDFIKSAGDLLGDKGPDGESEREKGNASRSHKEKL